MRALFDQYAHPENRLTHALVASLAEDTDLLRAFLGWLDIEPPRGEALAIVEQRLPGQEFETPEARELDERRLPDAWIYAASGWALLIESKIAAPIYARSFAAIWRSRSGAASPTFGSLCFRRSILAVPCPTAASTVAGLICMLGSASAQSAIDGHPTCRGISRLPSNA